MTEAIMERSFVGAKALVREATEEERTLPCFVRHEDAGGRCGRTAAMTVYGLHFCEVHGAEARAGALEELYHDASEFLERLDNPHALPPNPAALQALRKAISDLGEEESRATGGSSARDAALRRAYPLIPERVDEDALDFDYESPEPREVPEDWNRRSRMLIHKLMRIAHEDGQDHYLVEMLEHQRERVSAQLAFAMTLYNKWAETTSGANTEPDGG